MPSKNEIFVCSCGSMEHMFVVSMEEFKIPEPNPEDQVELYIHVALSQYHGFWGRLWMAIKYLFGHHCKYGHFDVVLVDYEKAGKLIEALQTYRSTVDKYRSERK